MCPDRDLVSAWVDGEVPSPWRERLEEHLAACSGCSSLAKGYASLGERLRSEFPGDERALLSRGRSRLDTLLEGIAGRPAAYGWKAFRRSVSLSLPLAAAAALLVLLLGGATALMAFRPIARAAIQAVASGEIAPLPSGAQAQSASMDELLRYLDARDGQLTLTINLPSGTTFGSAGKPVIMRRSQSVNAITVGGSSP